MTGPPQRMGFSQNPDMPHQSQFWQDPNTGPVSTPRENHCHYRLNGSAETEHLQKEKKKRMTDTGNQAVI
ncbi:hypothetical protein ACOMHN_059684 [Nucella lapillus]